MTPADHLTPPAEPTSTPPAAGGPQPPDLLAEPTFEECIEEWNRYNEDRKAGRVSVRVAPDGHYVAYFGGKIHDHDADGFALQNRVAAALGIHPARVVIDYPWMW
jgi:hypothetical protein